MREAGKIPNSPRQQTNEKGKSEHTGIGIHCKLNRYVRVELPLAEGFQCETSHHVPRSPPARK